jgi:hypothetical protein
MPLKEAFFVAVGVLTDLSTFIFLELCCSGSLDNGHALGFIVALIKGCKLWGEQSGHCNMDTGRKHVFRPQYILQFLSIQCFDNGSRLKSKGLTEMRPWMDDCDLDIILDQASSEFQANVTGSNDHGWTILLILDGC